MIIGTSAMVAIHYGEPEAVACTQLIQDSSLHTLQEYLAEAEAQKLDLTNLITPVHTGREITDDMLEAE